jgi:rhodanese-related sulfurtransferase
MASHRGAGRALELGYKNVFVMNEGVSGWAKAGKQVQKI